MGSSFLDKYTSNGDEKEKEFTYEQKSSFKPPKKEVPKHRSEEPSDRKRLNPKTMKRVIGGVIGVLVIVAVVLILIFTGRTKMPDLVGWKEADVNAWATENKVLLRYLEEFSDEEVAGIILSQSIEEGEVIKSDEFLELTVSKGADPSVLVKLPNFMTMSKSAIESWADKNHMTKVRITTENSRTIPQGSVITFTVNDSSVVGTEVRRDSPIYIIISNGTGENGTVTLPDFTTMTLEMAQIFATDNGIVLEIEELFDETIPKDQIISQDIEVDEVIKTGDTVKLKVSKGPEIIIPNFAEYTADVASTVAAQKGIVVTMVQTYSGATAGVLLSQSIPAGTLYNTDDVLTLTYSLGNSVLLPSFVGQGLDAIQVWMNEYNAQGTALRTQVTYTNGNEAPGTILTQNVSNTNVGISTTVHLVVSKGKVTYMPDFVADPGLGYADIITREKALALCNELGIVAVFQMVPTSGRLPGEVWSQSISPGTEVQQGTTVILNYTPVQGAVIVPNFIGLTEAQIVQAGYHKQFTLQYEATTENQVGGTVQVQSIAPNSTVAYGTVIILTTGN